MNAVINSFDRPRLLRGVCADIAMRAGTAAWLPRVAFLVFALVHWFLAIVLYVVLAKVLRAPVRRAAPVNRGYQPDAGGVRDRFGALDARLASLEAATLREEAGLARAFRDLERSGRTP